VSKLALAFQRINLAWALVGFLVTPAIVALLCIRLRLFLRQQNIECRFSRLLLITWAAQFFNSVLPGSTGGDVVKVYQLCRENPLRKAAATAAVVVDRLSALFALLVLVIVALAFGPSISELAVKLDSSWLLVALGAVAAVAAALFFILRRTLSVQWHQRISKMSAALIGSFNLSPLTLAAVLLAVVLHLTSFSIFYLFARSLGIGISYPQVLVITPVVLLAVMLPITVNGHGLRELLFIYYFKQMNIAVPAGNYAMTETVVSLSLVIIANDLIWNVPGGLWYLLGRSNTSKGKSD
jgi:uncharacterized protein (TIRG00374 family)